MPRSIKIFHVYFSKLKRSIIPTIHTPFATKCHDHHSSSSSSNTNNSTAAVPSTIKNSSDIDIHHQEYFTFDTETTNDDDISLDFATVIASQRLVFTSPGLSNSIVESSCTTIISQEAAADDHHIDDDQSAAAHHEDTLVMIKGAAIPIQTYSLDPFNDFRRSMQEMVEASAILNVGTHHSGEYLHQLLLCYLALNTKSMHTFIVNAFVDLLVSIVTMSPSGGADSCSTSTSTIPGINDQSLAV